MALDIKYKLAKYDIDNLLTLADIVSRGDEINRKSEFILKCGDLSGLWDAFLENHVAVTAKAAKREDDSESELLQEYVVYREQIYQIKKVLQELQYVTVKGEGQSVSNSAVQSQNISIPHIKLPCFEGKITEYMNFKNIFDSLVHENESIPPVRKMHYLIGCLKQEPLQLIRHLILSHENYPVAYELLNKRYYNKRIIANAHLESLLAVPTLETNKITVRELLNILQENTLALGALGFNVKEWSFVLLHIFTRKLSNSLRNRFELKHAGSDVPTFDQLLDFLSDECRALEAGSTPTPSKVNSSGKSIGAIRKCFSAVRTEGCVYCGRQHLIYACDGFRDITNTQRRDVVRKKGLCWNCLGMHHVKACKSQSKCKVCGKNHHTLVHHTENSPDRKSSSSSSSSQNKVNDSSEIVSCSTSCTSTVLLATAIIHIRNNAGEFHSIRALLDPGSQCSLITESCVQQLGLTRKRANTSIRGVGGQMSNPSKGAVLCTVKPTFGEGPLYHINALILKTVTGNLPTCVVSADILENFPNITLADTEFYQTRPVDMIIGADMYNEIVDGRRIQGGNLNTPHAYGTVFGWVLIGRASVANHVSAAVLSHTVTLEDMLTKFWESEDVPQDTFKSADDERCEEHFSRTVERTKSGRFMVRLPFKENCIDIGDTRNLALRRFYSMERRLSGQPELKAEYSRVISEYLELGHMERVNSQIKYFLPHHGVVKESSSTTKLRVVFDASLKSESGVSLNDALYPGPKLQNHISDIILNFRLHNIVFTADIKQMYRQILVHPDDRDYQGIFWRNNPEDSLQTFRLTTVTFGVSSSPFLAIRCLLELAKIGAHTHPKASKILKSDIFVDDVVSGASSVQEALNIKLELENLLALAGFELRKWTSNSAEFLSHISQEHCELPRSFESEQITGLRVLGVQWNSIGDYFQYKLHTFEAKYTKRAILSHIARTYDPCGWLAPVIFTVKVLLQDIWLLHIEWDEPLPNEIVRQWQNYVATFSKLSLLKIYRHVTTLNSSSYELHGFSDASQKGYGICIYLRSEDIFGQVSVHLILGKSKVAPIKAKLTIPRLELCGAVLLARSLNHIQNTLKQSYELNVTAWCDSQVVLAWLRSPVHQLKLYEGNRVSQIHSLCDVNIFRYVPTGMNPADCVSRGVMPDQLIEHTLWWRPAWLLESKEKWPNSNLVPISVSYMSTVNTDVSSGCTDVSNCSQNNSDNWNLFNRYSDFSKLVRVTVMCRRFMHNSRSKQNKLSGGISSSERNKAISSLVRSVQSVEFRKEIALIQKGKSHNTKLRQLHPFIDAFGVLRVGGRLDNAQLDYDHIHPMILPKHHALTRLIISHVHIKNMHAGPSLTLSFLRQQFWVLSGRSAVRQIVGQCVKCFKVKPRTLSPVMAPLPDYRVRPTRAFSKTGVDFAGPFIIRSSTLRNAKALKSYLCLFICMVTKAVHLELVSDLSTPNFLATLDRFVARRGLCTDIYSDCGTNFVGAAQHLKEIRKFLSENSSSHIMSEYLSERAITFHRNAPSAPHMGGIWESNIKSVKTHLKRVIGGSRLTFEEFSTVLARIEGVLNSRPLAPMTDNVDDLNALTPSHFLIGTYSYGLPEKDCTDGPETYRNRWEMVQRFAQTIWKKWHRDYLHHLHQRAKWTRDHINVKVGDLVLVREDNLPPLKWKMARISDLHPGSDGTVRVVTLRTAQGVLTRPVVKISPLPFN